MEVDGHLKRFFLDNLAGSLFGSTPDSHPVPDDRDLVEEEIDPVGVDPGPGMAEGAENPAPVCILSKESGLYQGRMSNGIGGPFRVLEVSRPPDLDLNKFGGSFSVFDQALA